MFGQADRCVPLLGVMKGQMQGQMQGPALLLQPGDIDCSGPGLRDDCRALDPEPDDSAAEAAGESVDSWSFRDAKGNQVPKILTQHVANCSELLRVWVRFRLRNWRFSSRLRRRGSVTLRV